MVSVISFVGRHNSGKTTVLEKVVRYLTEQGYRVGIIKHSSHDFNIDIPGTDSFRLADAGAQVVAISSPFRMAFHKEVQKDRPLDELCRLMQDEVDIIITEGFKREARPKIEVARQGISSELLNLNNLVAVVADFPVSQPSVPVFGFDETENLCRFIIDKFLDEH
jgi:molybdopterin-guanine dinucleotide biosynthesis protein B